MWYLFFTLIFVASVSSTDVSHTQHQSAVDAVIQRLKLEQWEKEQASCLEKTLTLLENVKNLTLWATWVWNANTIPSANLYGSWVNFGNYDQCMKPPWLETHPQFRTKYCLATLMLSDSPKKTVEYDPYGSTVEYLNSPTPSALPVNAHLWGLCVPSTCEPPSVVKIYRSMYDMTTFASQAPNITVLECQLAGDKPQPEIGFYLFIAMIASLVTIAAASTYYRCYVVSEDESPNSLLSVITKSFCIVKNRHELVKYNKEEIRVMKGMKYITAGTVVVVHQIMYTTLAGISDSKDYDKFLETIGAYCIHMDIVVDSFFAMSGLLHIKSLLDAKRQQNLLTVLAKRYIRLIGPFALTIFYLVAVSKYTASGPLWLLANEEESEVCRQTWPLSFLMLNTDPKYVCHAVSWYVPCDYQLAILGTVLFYFYRKDRKLGFVAFGTAAVLSFIIPGVLTYWLNLPALFFMDYRKFRKLRDYWEVGYTYTPSYSRAGAYLVGVAMGYLMTVYKPSEYRKAISKTWSVIGTVISLAVMAIIASLGQFLLHREYDPLEAAVITSTNRIVWAVAVCAIIGFCEYGTVPLVSHLLSFYCHTPMSRLTYGMYMLHPLIIQRHKFAHRAPWQLDPFSIAMDSFGTLTLSVLLSLVMWVIIEAPLINLTNHYVFGNPIKYDVKKSKKDRSQQENGSQHQNGHNKTKAA